MAAFGFCGADVGVLVERTDFNLGFDKLLEVNLEVSPFHWYACVGAAVLGCGYDIGFRCCCMVWVVL